MRLADLGLETDGTRAVTAASSPPRSLPALVAVAVAGGLLTLVAGLYGLLGAAVLGLGWLTASNVAVFATSQVVVAATLPVTADVVTVVAIEIPLFALLFVPAIRRDGSVRYAAALAGALLALGSLVGVAIWVFEALWVAVLVLAAVLVPTGYYLHRYARIVLHDRGASTREEAR